MKPQTYAYGRAFEHFLITEIYRLNQLMRKRYKLSYLTTKDDAEIDLILSKPGEATILIEIKSTDEVTERHLKTLKTFSKDIPDCESYCLSRDPHTKKIGEVHVLHWRKGLEKLGFVE